MSLITLIVITFSVIHCKCVSLLNQWQIGLNCMFVGCNDFPSQTTFNFENNDRWCANNVLEYSMNWTSDKCPKSFRSLDWEHYDEDLSWMKSVRNLAREKKKMISLVRRSKKYSSDRTMFHRNFGVFFLTDFTRYS